MLKKKSPTCKYCGELGHTKWQCYKYRYDKLCAIPLHTASNKRKKRTNTTNRSDKQTALKQADKAFSLYIRKKYSDRYGYCRCYTCGAKVYWKNADCSHYVERTCMTTRFNEDNVRVCCKTCNEFLHGNLKKFREHLVEEIGEQKVEELESKKFSQQTLSYQKLTTQDLKGIANKYIKLYDEIDKRI